MRNIVRGVLLLTGVRQRHAHQIQSNHPPIRFVLQGSLLNTLEFHPLSEKHFQPLDRLGSLLIFRTEFLQYKTLRHFYFGTDLCFFPTK